MSENELINLVSSGVKILNGRCEFELENATPSGWQATILEAGVKFFYRDGTDDTDGPRRINLQSGQKASFFSRQSSKCVYQVFAVIKVHVQGEPNDATYTYRDDAGANQCFMKVPVRLGPKNVVAEADLSSGKWDAVFEVTKA